MTRAALALPPAPAVGEPRVGNRRTDLTITDEMPDVRSLRIPLRYLANLLTAGDTEPVSLALERMLATRAYMRSKHVDGVLAPKIVERVGLTVWRCAVSVDNSLYSDMAKALTIAGRGVAMPLAMPALSTRARGPWPRRWTG